MNTIDRLWSEVEHESQYIENYDPDIINANIENIVYGNMWALGIPNTEYKTIGNLWELATEVYLEKCLDNITENLDNGRETLISYVSLYACYVRARNELGAGELNDEVVEILYGSQEAKQLKDAKTKKFKDFQVNVNDANQMLVRRKLEAEYSGILDTLKQYRAAGIIGSIKRPVNKSMQSQLNNLIKKKKILKSSINTIKQFFK